MFGNNKFKKSKLTYGLIIIFVFIASVVFFAMNSFVFAQGTESSSQQVSRESEQIVIKDIDTKKYPEINIYLNFKAGSFLGLSSLNKSNFTITENNEPVKNFDFLNLLFPNIFILLLKTCCSKNQFHNPAAWLRIWDEVLLVLALL